MRAEPRIHAQPRKIEQTSWKEYGIRFLFGGIITATVGIVAKIFGPIVAGLFLAFPAILPASLTLVAKHDGEHNAGNEALGAALGSLGLVVFGLVIWRFAEPVAGWLVLGIAMIAWAVASVLFWILGERLGWC